MKILVTGSTGFIGRNLIPEIEGDVFCLARKTSDISKIKKHRIVFGDLMDKSSLLKATEGKKIVIHLATSHTNSKMQDVIGSKNLIESCKKNKVKRIIFISSMAVKRRHLDDYGKTKLKIEEVIKKSKIPYTILRPSLIYSEDNLSLIGKSLSIPFIIPIIGNGKYKLNPIYIEDLIKVIIECIKNKDSINKVYDIAGPEKISFNEIISISKRKFDLKKLEIRIPKIICIILFTIYPIISADAVRGIDEDTNADITLMKKELKIKPIDFEEGIKNVHL